MNKKYVIMFVCTGNTCRSPMAEGGLRKLLTDRNINGVTVLSSGTSAATGFPATEYAQEAVKIWDADISLHESQPLTENLIEQADLIFALTPSHCQRIIQMNKNASDKTYLLKKYPEPGCNGDGVNDPIGLPLDSYNQTFLEIGEELGRILPFIVKEVEKKDNKV